MAGAYSIAIIILIACSSHTLCRQFSDPRGERDVTGENDESSSSQTDVQGPKYVCGSSQSAFLDDAQLLNTGEIRERYKGKSFANLLFEKPVLAPSTTMCTGLNQTCCSLLFEKELHTVIIKEYRELLHSVLESEYLRNCPSVGRESYHSVRLSLVEAKRLLTLEVQEALNTTLQNTRAIDNLFDYLIQFSITADLCPLRSKVRKVVEGLLLTNVVNMALSQSESTVIDLDSIEEEQLTCLKNITGPYIAEYTEEISSIIQRHLVDYKLYVESINLGRKVVTTVKNHPWSSACFSALARMKHCAYCGGYRKFKPCLNFCLNTLRGCLADVAEIYDSFKGFVSAFHLLSKDIDSSLKHESLSANLFMRFATMITEVRGQSSLKYLATRDCSLRDTAISDEDATPTSSSEEPHSRSRRSRFSQPIKTDTDEQSGTSFNTNIDFSDNSVSKAFSNERKCLSTFQELLPSIPQEMCYLSKTNAITNVLNSQCWTGETVGDYDEPLVGLLKREQRNNPSFVGEPLEMYILYESLILELRTKTAEINKTLNFKLVCSDSDDEDCARSVSFECNTEIGSGSGSGSGFGNSSRWNETSLEQEQGDLASGTEPTQKPDTSRSELNQPSDEDFTKNLPYDDQNGAASTTTKSSSSDSEASIDESLVTKGVIVISSTAGTQDSSTTEIPSSDDTPGDTQESSTTETSSSSETPQDSSTTETTVSKIHTQKTAGSTGTTIVVQTLRARDGSSTAAATVRWSVGAVLAFSVLSIFINYF